MEFVIACPNCKTYFVITKNDLNCGIFRCAILKHNQKQVNPHATMEVMETLLNQNKIIGCGAAFCIPCPNSMEPKLCSYSLEHRNNYRNNISSLNAQEE